MAASKAHPARRDHPWFGKYREHPECDTGSDLKTCPRCKRDKPLSAYRRKMDGGIGGMCRQCENDAKREKRGEA